jgi:hypothetical protein
MLNLLEPGAHLSGLVRRRFRQQEQAFLDRFAIGDVSQI